MANCPREMDGDNRLNGDLISTLPLWFCFSSLSLKLRSENIISKQKFDWKPSLRR